MKLFAEIVLIINILVYFAGVITNEAYRSMQYVFIGLLLTVANLVVLLWLLGAIHPG